MTREEYRAHPALNFSKAKFLLKSAAHFKAAEDEEQKETDAMRIGTLAHAMVLEGKDLRHMYAIKPEGMSFAKTDGKIWKAEQTLPIITEEEANALPRIAEAIAQNPAAASLLKGCPMRERPIFFTLHGVACKALLDACGTDGEKWAIADFKTSADACPRKFAKTVAEMDYDMQAAWYSDGLAQFGNLEVPPWWGWIVAEKKAPFVNVVYQPDLDALENGRRKIKAALDLYKDCQASGEWAMPYAGVHTLSLPAWANREEAA